MRGSYLEITSEGEITVIALNRSPVNAMSRALMGQLAAAVEGCEAEPSTRAVVIASSLTQMFSGGADIRELEGLDEAGCREFVQLGQGLFNRIEEMSLPVIAAIQGPCVGGGCELAMACDLRVAGHSARFTQPEVNLGVVSGWGGTQRLPRLIGKTRGMELLLLGTPISAEEALTFGLVNRLVPDKEVLTTAITLAQQLLVHSSSALASVKEAVQQGLRVSAAEGLEVERDCYIKAFATKDAREGIRAFLEKRSARFTGG